MRLTEFRFTKLDLSHSQIVVNTISHVFVNDVDLIFISDNKRVISQVSDFSNIALTSFSSSFQKELKLDAPHSMRSLISCRFVVFEDDGLVRICQSNDEAIIEFPLHHPEIFDISKMLVETDLFDYL